MFDRDLSSRIEREFIASLLRDPSSLPLVRDPISLDILADPTCRIVYSAALQLHDAGTTPTVATIGASLNGELKQLELHGENGYAALCSLDGLTERAGVALGYVGPLTEAHRQRKLRHLFAEAASMIEQPSASPVEMADLIQTVADRMRGLSSDSESLTPVKAADMLMKFPRLREPIIDGYLRVGETMNIVASPKVGKSWFSLGLSLCLATGRPWLGNEVRQGNVLYIDNELHPETITDRLRQVAQAMEIGPEEYGAKLEILSLRGRLRDINELRAFFNRIKPGQFQVTILDAMYRTVPKDFSENENADMARLYNTIDGYADRAGFGFVLIHHSTKGNQSGKSVTDTGAGAGAQSRAADSHLVLRPHQEPNAIVMEAAVRSWPPPKPVCLRWSFPSWCVDCELDPNALAGIGRRKNAAGANEAKAAQRKELVEKRLEADCTAAMRALNKLKKANKTRWREDLGWNSARLSKVITALLDQGAIKPVTMTRRAGRGGHGRCAAKGYAPTAKRR